MYTKYLLLSFDGILPVFNVTFLNQRTGKWKIKWYILLNIKIRSMQINILMEFSYCTTVFMKRKKKNTYCLMILTVTEYECKIKTFQMHFFDNNTFVSI